jgi:hypothetical protein
METPIDRAHAAMTAAEDDDQARLRFFERLADAELFLLLVSEAGGASLQPQIFGLEGGDVALAFDREDRLTDFVGQTAAYAALSGRALSAMLVGQGIGLGLNLGAPSQILLPSEALAWLAGVLAQGPDRAEGRARDVTSPTGLPENVVEAISVKLSAAQGLARHAYLAGVTYEDGRRGHLLAFTGAVPGAERALSGAISEALIFSGVEAGQIEVAFLIDTDPLTARLARVGLRFDLPGAEPPQGRAAPGSDPDAPPRLR